MGEYVNWKGIKVTREDVMKAMERFDQDLRASFPETRWVTYAIENDCKLYPPKETLRIATGIEEVPGGDRPTSKLSTMRRSSRMCFN